LPPVEDEDEEGYLSRPGSQNQQAMFYTPEASNTPSRESFSEKHHGAIEHSEESADTEMERLPTPPLQTAVVA
jgi:hypothetical protein